jgi:hypothetical protein
MPPAPYYIQRVRRFPLTEKYIGKQPAIAWYKEDRFHSKSIKPHCTTVPISVYPKMPPPSDIQRKNCFVQSEENAQLQFGIIK